jgi:hypothetical protein
MLNLKCIKKKSNAIYQIRVTILPEQFEMSRINAVFNPAKLKH